MSAYRVTFTPSGPYFFGNEKTFQYPGQKVKNDFGNLYYIRGERMPMQTTILGALRYVLLPTKGLNKENLNSEQNVSAIGKASFDIDSQKIQEFGQIKKIFPIFLRKDEEYFIPTPFDHNYAVKAERNGLTYYSPMSDYGEVKTLDGDKLYLRDYDAKEGIKDSFMSLSDAHLETELFTSDVRVGINRSDRSEGGFFKKEYIALKKGFAFAVFADIEKEGLHGKVFTVLLGQGKVPFSVLFEKADSKCVKEMEETIIDIMKKKPVAYNRIYCSSDMLTDCGKLYGDMRFAITKTRDHRSFKTKIGGGVEKGSTLHRLIAAGSIFIPEQGKEEKALKAWKNNTKQENAANIGFNQMILIEKGE
ncbi:MAG: hypothetical protein E7603_09865 [Ruminococcaceae bacterium]|nr:hypothetical protein [Oscillospiraceae bacterium]